MALLLRGPVAIEQVPEFGAHGLDLARVFAVRGLVELARCRANALCGDGARLVRGIASLLFRLLGKECGLLGQIARLLLGLLGQLPGLVRDLVLAHVFVCHGCRLLNRLPRSPKPATPFHPSTADNARVTESRNPQPPDVPPDPERPVLPDVTADEEHVDWRERADDHDRDDWYRRERPPH